MDEYSEAVIKEVIQCLPDDEMHVITFEGEEGESDV